MNVNPTTAVRLVLASAVGACFLVALAVEQYRKRA